MDEELNQLIREAKRGEKEAFASLVYRFKDHIYRYAYGMLNDKMEAEDASQEAFIKCYYSLSRLENDYSFASWLTRIVANVCMDRLKKRTKSSPAARAASEEVEFTEAREQQRVHNLKSTINEALEHLTLEHRQVIVLHDLQGYRYEEIAGLLGIPLGTVKSRLNGARLALRAGMKRGEE